MMRQDGRNDAMDDGNEFVHLLFLQIGMHWDGASGKQNT
jgi:hypothetical protein